ncbi:MAG: flagellar filament capping protein FliD [Roseburia sp.]
MPIRITGLNSGLDTESIISALVSSYSYKTDKYKKAQTKLSWKQEAWQSLNTKIYSLYNSVGNLRYSSGYNMHTATVSDSTKAKVTAGSGAVNGVQSLKISSIAQSGYLTGAVVKMADSTDKVSGSTTLKELGYTGTGGTIEVAGKTGETATKIEVTGDMTVSDFVSKLNSAGVKASFDSGNQRLFVSSTDTGEANDFSLKSANDEGDKVLKALGLSMASTTYASTDYNTGNSRIQATDAKITLNGAEYTSTTNEFSINGLSITTLATTGADESLSVTVSTDSEGLYDKVKEFITSYNSLINEMTSLYNADSAKGYEPLTDDEKDQMSDAEIEKWEEKVKSALLRRDDTLQSLMSGMTTAMAKTYTINGKAYSLSTFGIATLGIMNAAENEQNAYHINGDEDDSAVSGKEDKLLAAIKEDPDAVVSFMKELSKGLYNAIDTKMKSSTLSSSYKVYNDKEMASEYSDYTETITKWEDKLTSMEDYYYDKFSAMETALAKLNSQQSSLAGLLGS